MSQPFVEDYSWLRKKVLKYRTGAEPGETLVLYSSCVTANTAAKRLISAGTVVCEITSGTGDGMYGPYLKTASDGRQTIGATNQPFVLLVGQDVTLGDRAVEGLWQNCVFERTTIESVNGISHVAAQLTSLKTAFPNSDFR